MASTSITFKLHAETKGAVRYQEVNAKGQPVEGDDAFIGTLYFRKAKFGKLSDDWASAGKPSETITITVASK